MQALVSIIMGSMSDWKIMEKAAKQLEEFEIPFEINALSAHRTPDAIENFSKNAEAKGIKVIIAGAGMAAHLGGVIAANTTIPVIGVPINASLNGLDSLLAIVQMPPCVPVACMAIDGAQNAAVLAAQILALSDENFNKKLHNFKQNLKQKIESANEELKNIKYKLKTN
ncbi:MAG: 5-(carboxyamino)imidazole ribonucleotide mutase [Bacteroidales bacterium]|jgi:5-(carboxyamino)imidazole ribonucleotide mutase|nr:5-(carboxyamino)imidazole ribonucleotide mutase [Bacteroidales bacterium]